jgi:cell division protease FtsH
MVPPAPDVDLGELAAQTPGLVGADLSNLVNEAALLAARRDRDSVTMKDFEESIEKVLLGAERKIMLSREDRERVAYHEAGHAVLGLLLPGADPVRRVTHRASRPSSGRDRAEPGGRPLQPRRVLPAGAHHRGTGWSGRRAAGVRRSHNGAEKDLQHVASMARQMVVRLGDEPEARPPQLRGR